MNTGAARRAVMMLWIAAEIGLLWLLGRTAGWGWVLVVTILGAVAAATVVWLTFRRFRDGLVGLRRGRSFTAVDPVTGATTTVLEPDSSADPGRQTAAVEQQVRQAGVLLSAAALLAVPGLISDAVGLVMLLPPVRRRLAQSPRNATGGVFVVRGETLHRPPGDGPPQGPTVLPGQILPPRNDASSG